MLYSLFREGWDIYNSNGDQRITLCNIEKKIVESDAFVFTPGATLEDLFKVVSIFVGYQTLDHHLCAKPTVVLDADCSWSGFFKLLEHLRASGTVKQDPAEYLVRVEDADEVVGMLAASRREGCPHVNEVNQRTGVLDSFENGFSKPVRGRVCVFCSATIDEADYLAEGYEFGRVLATAGLGCVSGAGTTGIMGEVVRGSVEAGGWTGGSNVPHIIQIEGIPDGLSSFWLRGDIYTRMEVMIERSDAFVIFPGGAGTVQEMLALMIMKHQGHPLVKGKPVVVYNRGGEFWAPLVELLAPWCEGGEFQVVEEFGLLLPTVEKLMAAEGSLV
ncbi:MAG: LOG family protein [Verrucomicrobiota bacterium JB025]